MRCEKRYLYTYKHTQGALAKLLTKKGGGQTHKTSILLTLSTHTDMKWRGGKKKEKKRKEKKTINSRARISLIFISDIRNNYHCNANCDERPSPRIKVLASHTASGLAELWQRHLACLIHTRQTYVSSPTTLF